MRARFLFLGAIALASILAACGGGGGGGGTPPPTAPPTSPPTSGSASVTFGAPTSIPMAAGYTGTMQLPQGSGTATITMSTSANSNTSTLDAAHLNQTSSKFHTASSTPSVAMTSGGTFNGFLYVTITATGGNVVLQGYPGFTLTDQSSAFYLAQYSASYWYSVTGPSAISGSTNILPPVGASPAITIPSGTSLYLALYTGGVLPQPNPFGCVGVQADSVARNAQADVVGLQPIGAGASATYTGSLTETLSRTQPCAMPTATSQATVAVSVSASPSGGSNYTETSLERDSYATNTTKVTTAALVEPVSGTPATQDELSETDTDLTGNTVVTTYATPVAYAITSPLPYPTSLPSISNSYPASIVTTLTDGSSEKRTYTAPGVYTETDTIAGLGGTNSISVAANGSATYNINASNFASQGIGVIQLAFSAPTGGTINWTGAFGSTNESLAIPAWFSTSSPLYSDTLAGGATVSSLSLPSGCSNPLGIADFAPLTRTITNVDPALGTSETETITSYIGENYPSNGDFEGPACVVIADTQNLYYDYFLDTPAFFYFAIASPPAPIQTDTISESYYWSIAPSGLARVRDLSGNRAAMAGLQASINAHTSGIAFTRLVERARRIEAIDQSIATKGLGGVK